jgi:hypothetical protein
MMRCKNVVTFRSLLVLETLLVLTSLFLALMPCSNAATSQSQAVSALHDAEGAVVSAYVAVSKADAAGGNVSDLLVRLNVAGEVLTRAHIAYDVGDYDSALELSVLCQEKLNGFVADADALTGVAARNSSLNFMVNVIGSIAGSVGLVCLSFAAWVYLNRRYGKAGSGVS